ncbi:uncharacterized protein LOC142336152 [Convolutriloba macropyga]|uniref:uncharacterized protein LOC142336152 n=1 Tax=Convolutriloba macropyga TaxID=536237 RepID=UPI003F521987
MSADLERSITFLLSEDLSGLQVLNRDGKFVNITQADDPSHILVNLGDLMQRWTDDDLVAAKHRVAFSVEKTTETSQDSFDDEIVCMKRQSIAFFVHPDDATIVKSLKEQNKYPPISAGDYLKERFKATYK